jgi:hypothetical protein
MKKLKDALPLSPAAIGGVSTGALILVGSTVLSGPIALLVAILLGGGTYGVVKKYQVITYSYYCFIIGQPKN